MKPRAARLGGVLQRHQIAGKGFSQDDNARTAKSPSKAKLVAQYRAAADRQQAAQGLRLANHGVHQRQQCDPQA